MKISEIHGKIRSDELEQVEESAKIDKEVAHKRVAICRTVEGAAFGGFTGNYSYFANW